MRCFYELFCVTEELVSTFESFFSSFFLFFFVLYILHNIFLFFFFCLLHFSFFYLSPSWFVVMQLSFRFFSFLFIHSKKKKILLCLAFVIFFIQSFFSFCWHHFIISVLSTFGRLSFKIIIVIFAKHFNNSVEENK